MHSFHHCPPNYSATRTEVHYGSHTKACPTVIEISNYFHSNKFDLEFVIVKNSLLIVLDQITVESYIDNYVYFAQQWFSQVIQLSLINEFLGNMLITRMKLWSCQWGNEVPQQAIYIHVKINADVPEKEKKKD